MSEHASQTPQERHELPANKELVRALSEGREYTPSDRVFLDGISDRF